MTQMTAAGAEARSIARWAWQDPQERALDGLEQVNELAARAENEQDLAEIRDAGQMLSRLASAVNGGSRPQPGISAQLASPMTISEQIELAAIHGHHIKGTAYTFRHGWIPVIGQQLVDKYPQWLMDQRKGTHGASHEGHRAEGKGLENYVTAVKGQPKEAPMTAAQRQRYSVVHHAQNRPMTPAMRQMLEEHNRQQERAARAAARAQSPATPKAAAAAVQPRAQAMRAETASPAYRAPQKAGEDAGAARPATHAELAAADGDHALAALAQPGASMAAMKAYIDARVAAEVARQMGQVSAQQEKQLKEKLATVHKGQQKLIQFMRKTVKEGDEDQARVDKTQLVMYNIFNLASVGVMIAGITGGISPIAAAVAAGFVPLVNIIHDYVRSSG